MCSEGWTDFYLGEDWKKFFNHGKDLIQFFPNIIIVFYKIPKFRWGSILRSSLVPSSLEMWIVFCLIVHTYIADLTFCILDVVRIEKKQTFDFTKNYSYPVVTIQYLSSLQFFTHQNLPAHVLKGIYMLDSPLSLPMSSLIVSHETCSGVIWYQFRWLWNKRVYWW